MESVDNLKQLSMAQSNYWWFQSSDLFVDLDNDTLINRDQVYDKGISAYYHEEYRICSKDTKILKQIVTMMSQVRDLSVECTLERLSMALSNYWSRSTDLFVDLDHIVLIERDQVINDLFYFSDKYKVCSKYQYLLYQIITMLPHDYLDEKVLNGYKIICQLKQENSALKYDINTGEMIKSDYLQLGYNGRYCTRVRNCIDDTPNRNIDHDKLVEVLSLTTPRIINIDTGEFLFSETDKFFSSNILTPFPFDKLCNVPDDIYYKDRYTNYPHLLIDRKHLVATNNKDTMTKLENIYKKYEPYPDHWLMIQEFDHIQPIIIHYDLDLHTFIKYDNGKNMIGCTYVKFYSTQDVLKMKEDILLTISSIPAEDLDQLRVIQQLVEVFDTDNTEIILHYYPISKILMKMTRPNGQYLILETGGMINQQYLKSDWGFFHENNIFSYDQSVYTRFNNHINGLPDYNNYLKIGSYHYIPYSTAKYIYYDDFLQICDEHNKFRFSRVFSYIEQNEINKMYLNLDPDILKKSSKNQVIFPKCRYNYYDYINDKNILGDDLSTIYQSIKSYSQKEIIGLRTLKICGTPKIITNFLQHIQGKSINSIYCCKCHRCHDGPFINYNDQFKIGVCSIDYELFDELISHMKNMDI